MKEATRTASTVLLAFVAAVTLFVAYSIGNIAQATHQPADKVAATGDDLEHVTDDTVVLSETMRVSSPADLILQVTAECSILTQLVTGPSGTGGASDSAFAFGSVRFHIEIDGVRVPVAFNDTPGTPGQDDDEDDLTVDGNETGEVTFCNRAYQRTVTDGEDAPDGIDKEEDFIRTRTANAFNWFALDAGETYDVDGDNVINIEVIADYDTRTNGEAMANAFVGSRTLIVEPVHAANDESVGPGPVESGSPAPAPSGSCTPKGNSGKC
ncbi:MAG: hypothetical protein ABR613_05155 [Actinomycetota bacterium]